LKIQELQQKDLQGILQQLSVLLKEQDSQIVRKRQ